MAQVPAFLSVVFVVRDAASELEEVLAEATRVVGTAASDYELIVVDNASTDNSVAELKRLSGVDGVPNLQVYALTREVDEDTAFWVGVENALGDFVAVIDPWTDHIGVLPALLEAAVSGAEVVFADNEIRAPQSLAYRCTSALFDGLYRHFNGVPPARETPKFRILSRSVVNFILQHPHPIITYRHLPATGGFAQATIPYSAKPRAVQPRKVGDSVDWGMRMLVSSTRGPMRLVTLLSLFGAFANLLYSVYVVAIAIFKEDVAPGWVSMSLQQSGMFLLISLVLLVLGEYILHMARLSNEGPAYHVAQEFTSACMTRCDKLNVEEHGTEPTRNSEPAPPISAR